MIPRYAASLVAGVIATFILLWIMQILIATGKKALVDESEFTLGDFIRVQKEEIIKRDEDEPEPPEENDPEDPTEPSSEL